MMHGFDNRVCAEHLAGMVRYPTVSRHYERDMDFTAFVGLREYLEKTYPLTHRHLSREIVGTAGLLYHWRGSGKRDLPPLLLMGHQDVVPAGDETLWEFPPFAGTIARDRVWGRGASDCKSIILEHMEAIEHMLGDGFEPDFDIYLFYGYNEEVSGGENACAKACCDLLKSRGVRLGGVIDESGGICSGSARGVDVPVCQITIAEKGYADFEIIRRDPGGHSKQPGKKGALYWLAQAILAIEAHPFPYRVIPEVRTIYETLAPHMTDRERGKLFADVEGNWEALLPVIDNDPALAAMFHTTMVATMCRGSAAANILPEEASITVNCRILAGDTVASVKAYLEDILPDGMEVRLLKGTEPTPMSRTDGRLYGILSDLWQDKYPNLLVVPDMMTGGTDARFLYPMCDEVYRFQMYDISDFPRRIHSVNESMGVEQLGGAAEMLIRVLRAYGDGKNGYQTGNES